MEVSGRIKLIGDVQTFGNNGFQKREVVVTTEEQYPQSILVEFIQDKCSLLDAFQVGQLVKISINLRGREWVNPQGETKYFNSIQGWRIETLQPTQPTVASNAAPVPPAPPAQTFETTTDIDEDEHDDLPF